MQTYYYCPEAYSGPFLEFEPCLIAAIRQANRQRSDVDVYLVVMHEDGRQESIHMTHVGPSKEF